MHYDNRPKTFKSVSESERFQNAVRSKESVRHTEADAMAKIRVQMRNAGPNYMRAQQQAARIVLDAFVEIATTNIEPTTVFMRKITHLILEERTTTKNLQNS